MLKTVANFVLGRTAPCDVPQGYDSVAILPAASLDDPFEHPPAETWWSAFSCQQTQKLIADGVLLGEFFDEMTEFRQDQFFHRQAHGIF